MEGTQKEDYDTFNKNHRLFKQSLIKEISNHDHNKFKITFESDKSLIFNNIFFVNKTWYWVIKDETTHSKINKRTIDKWIRDYTSQVFSGFRSASVFQ